ncbi:hypothetical protein [Nocardia wallacei]|uniref:hypothetical protein n=1 Tax=Nocardia wallacei TaxID=480035 RepID=UPI002453F1EF|nr:hypothetical protein [Nocardia wallacei]
MPQTTPYYKFPYPLIGDPVRDGATAIRQLAERIEAVLKANNLNPPNAAQGDEP